MNLLFRSHLALLNIFMCLLFCKQPHSSVCCEARFENRHCSTKMLVCNWDLFLLENNPKCLFKCTRLCSKAPSGMVSAPVHIISTSSSSLCTNANNSLIVFISSLTKCLSCALRQQSVTLINIKTLVRHEVQSEHSAPLCQCLRRYIKTRQFALSSWAVEQDLNELLSN